MISRHLTSILRNHGRISKGALRLERSSSTNSREINPPAIYSSKKVVVTLDPRKFAEKKQRRFHIGDTRGFKPFVALHNQSNPVRVLDLRFFQDRRWLPYPPDTTAFLYFFMPPKKPRIAGELRLRVASSDDHASFESGSDLLKLDGLPWSRSLYNVSKYYTPLYEKLREEGFVPNDLDAVLSTFPKKKVTKCQSHSSLNDTFIVDFSRIEKTITIISEQGMGSIRFTKAFEEKRTTRMSPYTGRALVRFERSTLPEHEGTRTVVLRFLKIMTPVKCVIPLYDGYIVPPKEGELHRRSRTREAGKLNPRAWSANIDKGARLRGLQLLWDT